MSHQRNAPPHWELIGNKGQWQCFNINSDSDGDAAHWPGPTYRPSSEERYLILLGRAWAQKYGRSQSGVDYYVNKLPRGFALFEIDQHNGDQIYKRLFGHPSGKYYDSCVRFQPHFFWLMSGMQGECECVNCGKVKPVKSVKPIPPKSIMAKPRFIDRAIPKGELRNIIPTVDNGSSTRSNSTSGHAHGVASGRPQRQIKTAGAVYAEDAEGTEDVYKAHLKRLEGTRGARKGIEDDIREVNSFDWRAEHAWDGEGANLIQRNLTAMEHQHAFIPRMGELVLFCPVFLDGHYLMLDEKTQEYKFYSFDQECFHGFPTWRGGLVTVVPSANPTDGPVDFPDIQDLPTKRNSLNTGGFRVETFPDPNDEEDKKASKQYRYVPMRNIRPFSHWQMLLRGIPRDKWHPSIESALTCMTSISLLEKWWFNGDWPNASIWCKGIYIGAELIIAGDTVRIASQEQLASGKVERCTDVMVIDSIRLNLLDIKPEHTLADSPLLSSISTITLVGRAYTLDVRRHYELQGTGNASQITVPAPATAEEVKTAFRPVGSAEYGPWYHLHAQRHRYEVSYDQVLGRMHETAAVQLWTGKLQTKPLRGELPNIKPSLDFDVKAIREGRKYSTIADERLEDPKGDELRWFWADTRAEALDVETINGYEVGKFDSLRDKDTLDVWRTHLKIINGQTVIPDSKLFQSQYVSDYSNLFDAEKRRGRKPGSKVVDGKVIQPGEVGYEDSVGQLIPEPRSTPKHRTSGLTAAALASTDEEDEEDEEDQEDQEDEGNEILVFEDAVEESSSAAGGASKYSMMRHQSPTPKQKVVQRKPLTKAQIMAGDSDDSDSISGDNEWVHEPIPPARGGTEETEGGDYDPESDDDRMGTQPVY